MKRLFLSSSFEEVASLLGNFANEDIKGKTVTFIPTASRVEEVKFYVDSAKKTFEEIGVIIDELDLTKSTYNEIFNKLKQNDYIYISGGNTFFLLQELKKSGADKIIIDEINSGKLYIGESAGSIVLSPDIGYIKGMDNFEIATELDDFSGLNVIDFYPLPHYTNFPFLEAVEKIISTYESKLNLYPFTNNQVILVNGDKLRLENK